MRQEKQLLLDDIKNQITHYGSFLIMQYSGLKANPATEFRTDIAKLGGNIEVLPKRILIKAADAAGISLDLKSLPGHIGLVFTGADPIPVTKAVFQFKKDNAKVVEVLGAQMDNELLSAQDVEELSKLPGKDELRAQFLSVLEAPMSRTLATMESLLTSVIYCLDNKAKQASADQ